MMINMKYMHATLRVSDPEATIAFFKVLGMREIRRVKSEAGRFNLISLAVLGDDKTVIELLHNWDPETYTSGRNFAHLAFSVNNIYDICRALVAHGANITRPPRDGRMAFVSTPDGISLHLTQNGKPLPPKEPWSNM
jgi:lactoylglutathione lyase